MLKDISVHDYKYHCVDDETQDTHCTKLQQLRAQGSLPRFGKGPEPVPSKIAQHGSGEGDAIGCRQLDLMGSYWKIPSLPEAQTFKGYLHHIEHGKVDERAYDPHDRKPDKSVNPLGIGQATSPEASH